MIGRDRLPDANAWNALCRIPSSVGLRLALGNGWRRISVVTFAALALLALKVRVPALATTVIATVSPANAVVGGVLGIAPVGLICSSFVARVMKALMAVGV